MTFAILSWYIPGDITPHPDVSCGGSFDGNFKVTINNLKQSEVNQMYI